MRYGQDSSASPLTLESSAQPSSSVLNLYAPGHSSAFTSAPTFPHDTGNSFYAPQPTTFLPHIDHQRPRLGSSTSTPGMAQALRHTTLPHPGTQLSTREVYSPSTPTYNRRGPEHPRSPPYPPGINTMSNQYPVSKQQQNIPPLQEMRMHGTLSYSDAPGSHIKPEINGTIDKGFFLADNEWTCYRRNYFSCICSFHIPSSTHPQATLQFTPSGSSQSYQVAGWAMSISAVVSENDAHTIELVQHTPKRDKGPIVPPEKIRLNPKTPQAAHHPLGHYGGADMGLAGSSRAYEQSIYGQMPHPSMHASLPTEHTFERIQFKQATANNGKRRAAQQYYHLVVELYADIGPQGQGNEQFLKVAHKKSAKMIVRGRSPGHYQNERRASTSSGPGAGGSGMGGYPGSASGLMSSGYASLGSQSLTGGYGGYDARSNDHYRTHSDAIPMEPMISPEESKGMHEPEKYQYYPASIVEPHHDARQPIEMFHHPNSRAGDSGLRGMGNGLELTSKLYAGPLFSEKPLGIGRFEGKSSSTGYYPTMMPPSVGLSRAEMDCKQTWRTSMSPMITSSTN
ncbi:hypothetical protein N0V93_007405 [Gnomoniopsis smithogilvyi]|uniref:NDT80 domain-containing protein n=1 Tax=Gnomoniopsis smithogilvyi TaxID=1191159 RepID=A0A9W9CWM3_9PEZI|nr:hypothetical protein N0V93_007405 [Gnomoniopsis smithogilvyi]